MKKIIFKYKILLITLFMGLSTSGCKNDKDDIIEKRKLIFDAYDITAGPDMDRRSFTCENTDNWHVFSIIEIFGADTITNDTIQKNENITGDWYTIEKKDKKLSIFSHYNLTDKERSLIIHISSDSLYENVTLKMIKSTFPDLTIEDSVTKSRLTGCIWRELYPPTHQGEILGEHFEFLENGKIRVYYNYPDKNNNYRDESEYKITKDYFYREDFFVKDPDEFLYYDSKRRIYTYKLYDSLFEIKIRYGLTMDDDTFNYIRVDD